MEQFSLSQAESNGWSIVPVSSVVIKPLSGEWGQEDTDGTGVKVLRTTNFTDSGFIDYSEVVRRSIELKKVEAKALRDGDVLIEKSGGSDTKPVGRVVFYQETSENFLFNNFTALLRPNTPKLNSRFLFTFLFVTYWNGGTKLYENKTTGIHNLKLADYLDNTMIPIPPIEDQEVFAAFVEQSDKSQFIERFGIPGTDPYGWGLTTLGTCCELNPRRPKDINVDVNYSFVAMPSVSEDGRIDSSITRPYSEVSKGFTYFAENDVLFAKITPCMENGKGGVAVGLENGAGFGSTEFHVLRPINGISDPYWLYIITMFKKFRSDAEKVMTGTGGQRRVPITYLSEYRIALPPISLQEQFAAFVRQSDKSKYYASQAMRL